MFQLVIRHGTIATASETYQADVGIVDGQIATIAKDLPRGEREIDATGLIVAPGAIDVHTHFEHFVSWIGAENADSYESGTRAAAAGGITTILNFAFQDRGEALAVALDRELEHAAPQAHIDYGMHLVPTDLAVPGVLRELSDFADQGFASIKIFTTIGDYRLPDEDILKVLDLARQRGLLVNVHAEDEPLISHLTESNLQASRSDVRYLPLSRPPLAEALATRRIAEYARLLGTPVYFVHLSSLAALESVRAARAAAGEVYVETRPVYLYLDESRYELPRGEGNKWVCLPPLRERHNQDALWAGLRNGEIQTYATDHAPWQSDEKLGADSFPRIPAGVSNVQTSIGMLYAEGVLKDRISLNQFVAVTSTNPAKLFGMWPRKGTISAGADADFVVLDPQKRVTIESAKMESNSDYDPYDGYEGVGWPVMTVSRGEIIYDNGSVVSRPGRGRLLKRARFTRL